MKNISQRKTISMLLSLLLLLTIFNSICNVYAKGSSKGKDVWWEKTEGTFMGTWKANIYMTGNGVIHEWRYEHNGIPVFSHLIYKPVELYPNQPMGKNWLSWTFTDIYVDLPGDEADLEDFFTRYSEYWVHFNPNEY